MNNRTGGLQREAAFAGRRIRQKVCLALTLAVIIPLLVLAYTLCVHVLPALAARGDSGETLRLQLLLVSTLALALAGGTVIWNVAMAIVRAAETVTSASRLEETGTARADELGTLMGAFSRMAGTIEAQAGEINGFARRLERAYAELEVTNARLKEFSYTDEVTGLYNRRFFGIRLEEEVSRYRRFDHPVAVVLLDLDGFKAINDELGHAAGDATLREMADILLKHSRGINVICRYGGDEFAVLLVETGKAGARLYAERIREVLSRHRFAHGRRVTASFGLASLPEDVAPGAEELIQAADEALYAAKRAGKNRVSVYEAGARPKGQEVRLG
jgi:diguanylate cyclase (GGDEF)-like protein